MKNLKVLFALFICAVSFNLSYAQTTKAEKKAAKAADIKRIITSNNYAFKANYVIPMSMSPRALTSDYDVRVTKGKLEVYLPYFGRAYAAPRDLNDGGIKLNTTDYDYKAVEKKNGGWDITIKPKKTTINTVGDVQIMRLNVSTDGYASLQVNSTNRQPISFNGYIEEIKNS
ncbi:MAG: DUF4251 domain-containing protein [Bacteroidota bacterium]|jgi:hypothetical protein